MLIYNFQKEFLGIDTKDLQELGYHDLSSLRSEVTDFADLFVKTPGYIHNFQHVHWIDFIDCADDGEPQRVIINANGKNFTANLVISYAYLTDNPIEKAYLVHLHNLRTLTNSEVEQIHDDILQRPAPTPAPAFHQEVPTPETPAPIVEPSIQTAAPTQDLVADVEDIFTAPPEPKEVVQPSIEPQEPQIEDVKLDLDMDTFEEAPLEVAPPQSTPTPKKKVIHKKEHFDNGYIYNPEVASKELGLPLDLIEEFIQDFIAQAGDFKPELYSSLDDGDIDNVKTLSHKLKGVAANLRIEDAFETLTIINTTSDLEVIRTNMDLFYKIIAKLAGEDVEEIVEEEVLVEEEPVELVEPLIEQQPQENDELTLEFKDDLPIQERATTNDEALQIPQEDEDMSLEFKEDDILDTLEEKRDEEPKEAVELQQEETPKLEINYSKSKVANEIGLDTEIFNELFDDFIDETRVLTNEMQEAVSIGDFDLLKSEVMKLKGMSENMRINSFNNELSALMHSTNSQESLKLIDKIHDILEELSKVGA